MAAPTFEAAGTYSVGTPSDTTAVVAVPAGVVAGAVILVHLHKQNNSAVTPPDGSWTEDVNSPVFVVGKMWLHVFTKRASGADAGTYDFTWTGGTYWEGTAQRYASCVTSGSPIDVSNAASNASLGTTTPSVSLVTTGDDRLLVWAGMIFALSGWTPPGGLTERVDTGACTTTVATAPQAAAGSTGSLVGNAGATEATAAYLIALLPVPAGIPPVSVAGIVTPVGTLIKEVIRQVSGEVAPTGALTFLRGKNFSGEVTPSGTVTKLITRSLAGTTTPTGGLSKRLSRLLAGVLTLAGDVVAVIVQEAPQTALRIRLSGNEPDQELSGREPGT